MSGYLRTFATLAGVTCLFVMPAAVPAPVAWVLSSMERAGRNEKPGVAARVELKAGRGESQSFQVCIRGSSGVALSNVNISATDLEGPGGAVIRSASLTFYREHHVYVSQSSANRGGPNPPHGAGWYPDGLIPFADPVTGSDLAGAELDAAPFRVANNTTETIWADLAVPRTTVAGEYAGKLTVKSDQGAISIPLAVTVWNFELPLTPSLKSSFQYWTQSGMQMSLAAQTELLKNKVMPLYVSPSDARGLMNTMGLNAVGLGFFSGASYGRCSMRAPPSREAIESASAQYPSNLFIYSYFADEIDECANLFPAVRRWGSAMQASGVRSLVTMAPVRQLANSGSAGGRSAVDIWAIPSSSYDSAAREIRAARERGESIWSYNGNPSRENYSPKWLIDFDLIDFRIQPGFISQSLGLSGILYWRVDRWNADAWNDVNNRGVFGRGYNFPGEGMLVYPGKQVGIRGVAPSMRLKQIRDGVQDYEYIEMLKKLGRGEWALAIARTVGADWHQWTHDFRTLEAGRERLGRELDRLSAAPPVIRPSCNPGCN